MKPEDLPTTFLPRAVAERMRISGGSEEARRKLFDLDIAGTTADDVTGLVHFYFRSARRLNTVRKNEVTGESTLASIPIDGFSLDPNQDWALINWFLRRKESPLN